MPSSFPAPSRRAFLQAGTFALLGSALGCRLLAQSEAAKKPLFTRMGLAAPLDKAAAVKAEGAEFLTESVDNFLVPDESEDAFDKKLEKLKASPLPILACNGFIRPKQLLCIGPKTTHDEIVARSEIAFRRMKKAGGTYLVFGSAGSRKLPEGWAKEKADEQFVALLKRLGPAAQASGVTVVIEQLNSGECNYITRISEGAAIIRAANHPNVRLLADFYHMAKMDDTPADLKAAMDTIVHFEIAEKKGRTVPGVSGDDFRPYLRVLREAGYQGTMSIEGNWKPGQLTTAFKEIAKQASEV